MSALTLVGRDYELALIEDRLMRAGDQGSAFVVRGEAGSDDALMTIGDSEIRLRAGTAAADFVAANGEGLAAIWLEAEDVDQVGAALDRAGLAHRPVRREAGRRVLEVDPKAANMVPLFIFDRRL